MGYIQPTAISMTNGARKSYSSPRDWPDPLHSPATTELSELYIESWDRECLSSSSQGYGP